MVVLSSVQPCIGLARGFALFWNPLPLNIRVRRLLHPSPIELSYQCRASGASEISNGGSNTHLSLKLYPYGREGRSTESSSIRKLRSWSQDLPRVQSPFLDVSKALSDYGRSQIQEVTPSLNVSRAMSDPW